MAEPSLQELEAKIARLETIVVSLLDAVVELRTDVDDKQPKQVRVSTGTSDGTVLLGNLLAKQNLAASQNQANVNIKFNSQLANAQQHAKLSVPKVQKKTGWLKGIGL